ncbi:MAG: HAD-IIIC family phosphatase [Planctomycetota bacterium]
MRTLRGALRRGLDAHETLRAGRLLQRATPAGLRVDLLGQCTTSWLAQALRAAAWRDGLVLELREGGYDNVLQELLASGQAPPAAVMLLPWHQRLLAAGCEPAARVDDELAFWEGAWRQVQRLGARLLQVGYDWTGPGALGAHLSARGGAIAAIRRLNDALRERLPEGAYFVDLEQVSGALGRERFYDPRSQAWTRQPFGEEGAQRLGEHLAAGLRALTSGPKKVLVVDLDDTVWGGVVGEDGALGLEVSDSPAGAAFRAFQGHLKALAAGGCLLAACSKNDPAAAREPFLANPSMVLRLEDFAAFEASWDPKSVALERIARDLRLGLDSFVFFDDNPAEREQVRQALPEVAVVEVPAEPAEYVRALERGLWFEATHVGPADLKRAAHYQGEQARREHQERFATLDDYLESLEMRATLAAVDVATLPRVVQLLGKTNQFNLTTRRHSREQVERLLAIPRALGLTLSLSDRFGDSGLVAVVLGAPRDDAPEVFRLDTFLMSCRVIARGVEACLVGEVAARARELEFTWLEGEFMPNARNGLTAELYPGFGFAPLADEGDGVRRFRASLAELTPPRHFVQVVPD